LSEIKDCANGAQDIEMFQITYASAADMQMNGLSDYRESAA
jgi:hypothetical protein